MSLRRKMRCNEIRLAFTISSRITELAAANRWTASFDRYQGTSACSGLRRLTDAADDVDRYCSEPACGTGRKADNIRLYSSFVHGLPLHLEFYFLAAATR